MSVTYRSEIEIRK